MLSAGKVTQLVAVVVVVIVACSCSCSSCCYFTLLTRAKRLSLFSGKIGTTRIVVVVLVVVVVVVLPYFSE